MGKGSGIILSFGSFAWVIGLGETDRRKSQYCSKDRERTCKAHDKRCSL